MKHFTITPNTDTIDIHDNSLGISVRVDGEPDLNINSGLHVQIRHNKDEETFKAANQLSKLLVAAPEMLDAIDSILERVEALRDVLKELDAKGYWSAQ